MSSAIFIRKGNIGEKSQVSSIAVQKIIEKAEEQGRQLPKRPDFSDLNLKLREFMLLYGRDKGKRYEGYGYVLHNFDQFE